MILRFFCGEKYEFHFFEPQKILKKLKISLLGT